MDLTNYDICTLDDIFDNINKANRLYQLGKYSEAYKIISEFCSCFDMLAQIHLTGPNLGTHQYKAVYLLAGNICGELGKFEEALNYYKKHQFFNLQLNHDFQGKEYVPLFQFRNTKSYTLENLKNNEITLVDPRIQNDIVDSPIFSWLDSLSKHKQKKHIEAYIASFNYLRATSFCTDSTDCKAIENTLMWAHYANCHKGICVEYQIGEKDFSSNSLKYATVMRLMRIKYADPQKKEDVLDFTNEDTELNFRAAFATKSIDWQYEHEVRLIAYTPTDESKFVQCYLETPNPIKAIYFGVKCSTQRKNAVRNIFVNRPEVKFYQMKINPKNIHRLEYIPC